MSNSHLPHDFWSSYEYLVHYQSKDNVLVLHKFSYEVQQMLEQSITLDEFIKVVDALANGKSLRQDGFIVIFQSMLEICG